MNITAKVTKTQETTGYIAKEVQLSIPFGMIPEHLNLCTEVFQILASTAINDNLKEVIRKCYRLLNSLTSIKNEYFDALVYDEESNLLDRPAKEIHKAKIFPDSIKLSLTADHIVILTGERKAIDEYYRYIYLFKEMIKQIKKDEIDSENIFINAFPNLADHKATQSQIYGHALTLEENHLLNVLGSIHEQITLALYLPNVDL